MILTALCELYENLVQDPESGMALPNYSSVPCSYAIELSRNGDFNGIITLVENKQRVPLIVPEQAGRCGKNPPPYFLCDNTKYLLGAEYDKKEKNFVPTPERLRSAYDFYQLIIGNDDDVGLKAILTYLKNRMDDSPIDLPPDHLVYQSGSIVFRLADEKGYIHDRPAARKVWERFCNASEPSEERGQCLVTGLTDQPIAKTHTQLKGVADANPTGCVIVGFNFPSVTSYGKTQSNNAPVSEKAMFAYTTALNYLLSKNENRIRIGDTTVVFWTDSKEGSKASSLISALLGGEVPTEADTSNGLTELQILDILKNVRSGKKINDPDYKVKTYILGLAPNSARASIRFWYEDTLENFILKTGEHAENMDIVKSAKLKSRLVSIGDLLRSITVKSSKKWWENIPSSYETALFRAIISGDMYPTSVYSAVLMRIRAETGDDYGVDYIRVGYLKAYLKRYYQKQNMTEKMEELTVSLNQNSTDTAYSLGRLFAVMEALQQKANGTATIRSRYFASASANPKMVFPTLLNLAQHHIAKIDGKYYDKQMETILSNVTEFPAALNLDDQGKFVLGYYHQREFIYTKKEDKIKMEA